MIDNNQFADCSNISCLINTAPHLKEDHVLSAQSLDTPLGRMIAISNEDALYLLEFVDCRGLEREINLLKQKTKSSIILRESLPIYSIQNELDLYFKGQLKEFKTKLFLFGTPFQKIVWAALKKIPYGKTQSYLKTAKVIAKPTACRAVANANGANQIAIVIPCHRVINADGGLGGYAGGISRKKWLIEFEQNNA